MDEKHAIKALSALAQEHRMRVFRLLIQAGPSGRSAGEIGERLGLTPSNVSFHVSLLERAGLLRSWRVRRHIFYAVEIDGMRQLLTFLTEDCCGGLPEFCGALASAATICESDEESAE